MSATASRWQKLHDDIRDGRQSSAHTLTNTQNAIVRRLKALGEKGHCSTNAIGWLQVRKADKGITKIEFKSSADARDAWNHPAVRLRKLEHLEDDAVLTLTVDVDNRSTSILTYSVSIVGKMRRPGSNALEKASSGEADSAEGAIAQGPDRGQPWYARIDLTETPEGHGICGHPLLHCHIGADAEPNVKFTPRVPLPWLHPADALDWLLATVDRSLEP